MREADRCLVHRTELNEAERRAYREFAGLTTQTPVRKGQRVRTDVPGRVLPKGNEPHRIARERGKTVGRPVGVANGWNREDSGLEQAVAKIKAKCDVGFFERHRRWPTEDEAWEMHKQAIPVDLLRDWVAMRKRRGLG